MSGKVYHMAALIDRNGNVSPLCAAKPKPINLKKATWTNRREAVTCPRCRKRLGEAAK